MNTEALYPEGWGTRHQVKNIRTIQAKAYINSEYVDHIKQDLCYRLAQELFDSGFVNFKETTEPYSYDRIFYAGINVVESQQKYINLEERTFIVQNEHFSNEDLVKAVKIAFPERFL